MAHWDYKVLSGGKMGLGSMSMLEQFLNELGQQQWEVISWQTDPESPLKFAGLARRPILRDLAPNEMPAAQDKAAIAAAKEEEEKEREAWIETLARERELYASVVEAEEPVIDEEDEERDLVGDLFDTIRPLMKRNKRGPGASGSVTYLAKRLDQSEEDLIGALEEAGLELEDDATDSEPHLHDTEMFWLNSNSRGEIWINSMPKSRYRPPQPMKKQPEPRPGESEKGADQWANQQQAKPAGPLPEGEDLLEKIRPMMRRNRGNRGLSGSLPFLSRALRHTEDELSKALEAIGLKLPEDPKAEPVPVEIGNDDYWLNKNEKGQVWINAHPRREDEGTGAGETADGSAEAKAALADGELPPVLVDLSSATVFELVRPHLAKVGRSATSTGLISDISAGMGVSQASLLDSLVGAGLEVPVEAGDRPVFAEGESSQFWLSRGDDDALSLDAKPARKSRAKKKD